MGLRIEPYTRQHEAAAKAFNERLRSANAPLRVVLPEDARANESFEEAPVRVSKRQYVVLEGNAVRGGFILQEQPHQLRDKTQVVWNLQAPISEGFVDRRYGNVATFLLTELQRRNPLIYSVGMGSAAMPYPRLLKAFGWHLAEVPFLFRVCNAARFLRETRAIRTTAVRRALLNMGAWSGLAGLGIHAVQAWRTRRPGDVPVEREPCSSFGSWADDVWENARQDYNLCAVRTHTTLNWLYRDSHERLIRLRILMGGDAAGWSTLLITHRRNHLQFGNLRVGTIVDCMAPRKYAGHVVQAAMSALEDLGVDLIVSNQSHEIWLRAFRDAGFFRGPSNYLFGASKKLAETASLTSGWGRANVNRGDGDGIVNL